MAGGLTANVPVIALVGISILCQAFVALVVATQPSTSSSASVGGSGFSNVTVTSPNGCSGPFSCIGKVVGFIADVITFNIDGAPFLIRFIFGSFFVISWVLVIMIVLANFIP